MPLTHFLTLLTGVILAAGATIALTYAFSIPLIWLALGALIGAAAVRGFSWR